MHKDIQIIDNFLERNKFLALQENVIGNNKMPWMLSNNVASRYNTGEEICEEKYNYQLAHTLFDNAQPPSPFAHILNDFLDVLDPMLLLRVKVNLNPSVDKFIDHGMHIDILPEELAQTCTTGVFYLNTNNGYTKFQDGSKVDSVENRLVLFPAIMKHTGSTCTDEKYRAVLNVNYILRGSEVQQPILPLRDKQ